jgi:uncharacterized protein involved in outer membrane biogenesis
MRKILLIVAAAIVVILLVATIAVYWFLSGDGIRGALEQQASSYLGQPVKIEAARAQLFPRPGIRMTGIQVGEPVQLSLATVDLSTDLRALLSRRIEDARILVADSRIQMPLSFGIPENSSTRAGATTSDGSGVEVVSVRDISLRDIRMVSRGREVRVSADSSLNGNKLTIESFTAESGSTSLNAEGEAVLEPTVDASLKIKANKVDVDELLALTEAFAPKTSSNRSGAPAKPMKVSADIAADSATAAGLQITQFNGHMALDGDRVVLSPLTFALFGGGYDGALNARLGDRMSMTLRSRLKGLDVAQIAAFGGSPDTITGTLSGEGTFSAQGADMAAALASANGKGSASIADGTIKRLDLVRTVVLFFGRPAPDTAAATDQFQRIDTTFSLANQVFRADTFSMHSRDADIAGTATLALQSGALDGTVDLKLSEELSAQAGTDLARFTREQNRIVLPARLGGTLQQPRITINAVAALRRGIQNEIGERLKGLFGK